MFSKTQKNEPTSSDIKYFFEKTEKYLYTPSEVAEVLGVHHSTIGAACRSIRHQYGPCKSVGYITLSEAIEIKKKLKEWDDDENNRIPTLVKVLSD